MNLPLYSSNDKWETDNLSVRNIACKPHRKHGKSSQSNGTHLRMDNLWPRNAQHLWLSSQSRLNAPRFMIHVSHGRDEAFLRGHKCRCRKGQFTTFYLKRRLWERGGGHTSRGNLKGVCCRRVVLAVGYQSWFRTGRMMIDDCITPDAHSQAGEENH